MSPDNQDDKNKNGWNEWSRHVLKELERLNDNYEALRDEVAKTHGLDDLKVWKQNMDEVISPTQIQELKAEVSDLKAFKIKSTTIFAVVQIIMGLAIALRDVIF